MKTKVEVTYDTHNDTYNVMTQDKQCLEYGSAEKIDAWLFGHKDTHEDVSDKKGW